MKKTLLTLALVLTLGLVANAQSSSNWFEWEDSEEYFDPSSIFFDWNSFTNVFDYASNVNIIDEWASNFDLRDVFDGLVLPGVHEGGDNIDASPLGSGIAVLAGLGVAYAMAKRRRKE